MTEHPYRTDDYLKERIDALASRMLILQERIRERKNIRLGVPWYKKLWRRWHDRCPICATELRTTFSSLGSEHDYQSRRSWWCQVNRDHYYTEDYSGPSDSWF